VIGERLDQAGWFNSSQTVAQVAAAEAGFTSSSDPFARVSNAKKELRGKER
jgi:hypothetical protein